MQSAVPKYREEYSKKALFVRSGEPKYVRGGERVCVGDEIQQECLSANSDDLSTFLQLSSELCPKRSRRLSQRQQVTR